MTYQNLGYWVGQANDNSGGRHPTGFVAGQRWSATAGQWMSMFDSSQSALAAMTADRDTWQSRANQAWGDSRQWSNGTSFEADRNYWRDTVAHGDPNVWTNRYNAGYTDGYNAGLAAIAPYTQIQTGLGNFGLTGTFQVAGTITLTRTGRWHMSWQNAMGDGGQNDWVYTELHNDSAGGAVLCANIGRMRVGGVGSVLGNHAFGTLNSGTVIRLYARLGSGAGNWSIDGAGLLAATFSPTTAQPA